MPSAWYVAVYLFGLITLVCVGIERFGKTQVLQEWRPGNLPPATGKQRSRFEISAEIAVDVVFILWWLGLIHFRNMIPYPGLPGARRPGADLDDLALADPWLLRCWKWPRT